MQLCAMFTGNMMRISESACAGVRSSGLLSQAWTMELLTWDVQCEVDT